MNYINCALKSQRGASMANKVNTFVLYNTKVVCYA